MNVMYEIIERIKDVISHDYPDKKIKDKHVAFVLNIKPNSLAILKTRGLLPYEDLVYFCIRRKISLNWLLFGIGSKGLDDAVKGL